jgi:hypothetical protein
MRAHATTLHAERVSRLGAGLSLACALHCLTAPVALTLLPLGGLGFLADGSFEIALVVISFVSAALGLCWGAHVHGEWRLLAGLIAAFGLFLSSWLGAGGAPETLLSALGSAILAASLVFNQRLCRTCANCAAQEPEAH